MRLSRMFLQTLRDVHGDGDPAGLQLLQRAGFLRTSGPGAYALLPMGHRTILGIAAMLHKEMDRLGALQLDAPIAHYQEGWLDLSRGWNASAPLFKDRAGREMALATTLEPAVADLVRRQVRSYRQLPVALYQLRREFRDEPASGGLIRTRESMRKSLLSFHATADDLEQFYGLVTQSYLSLFSRCGLEVVESLAEFDGAGQARAVAFVFPAAAGEENLLVCPTGDFSAGRDIAPFSKNPLPQPPLKPLEEVLTPECKTMDALAQFLGVPKEQTAKTLFLMAADRLLCVVLRGDMMLSESKLARLVGVDSFRPATEDEIRSAGAVPGYGSAVGLSRAMVVVDDLIPTSPNLVAGANRDGYHLLNVNCGRDFQAELVGDIAAAQEGDRCVRCGAPLQPLRGTVLGGAQRFGPEKGTAIGANFLNSAGKSEPMAIGSYFVDLFRLLAAVAEAHHDDKGLTWPSSVTPYHLYLMTIGGDRPEVATVADQLYEGLRDSGIATLYDDRMESPGAKFGDADLIGLPLRLTVSQRGLKQGEVEMKRRRDGQLSMVKVEDALREIQRRLD